MTLGSHSTQRGAVTIKSTLCMLHQHFKGTVNMLNIHPLRLVYVYSTICNFWRMQNFSIEQNNRQHFLHGIAQINVFDVNNAEKKLKKPLMCMHDRHFSASATSKLRLGRVGPICFESDTRLSG